MVKYIVNTFKLKLKSKIQKTRLIEKLLYLI